LSEANWHILGVGAIGGLFAEALSNEHLPVTLLLKDGTPPETLRIDRGYSSNRLDLPHSCLSDEGPITHLLVTTKAYDVEPALRAIESRLTADADIILLCNGMGIAEQLESMLPTLNIFRGTTTAGAHRIGSRHLRHAGAGRTRIGKPGVTKPPAWFDRWHSCVDSCQWDTNINSALWDKLAINAVINPITAIHRCKNGLLAEKVELMALVKQACAEVIAISARESYRDTAENLSATVLQVIQDTAQNRSSMLQDIEAGRRTEIDYITGYLLDRAQALGIEAPANLELYQTVKALEL
jgi:2-dehydropantoate 2-reductase